MEIWESVLIFRYIKEKQVSFTCSCFLKMQCQQSDDASPSVKNIRIPFLNQENFITNANLNSLNNGLKINKFAVHFPTGGH